MKSKSKLDQAAIQQFFIDHTEKIVMGVLGLAFCYLAYDAVVRPRYAKRPSDLKTLIASATQRIDQGPGEMDQPAKKLIVEPFAAQAEEARKLVVPPAVKPLMINPVSPRRPRGMPNALAARNLIATPGKGALNLNGKQEGKHWIVVTGLVPVKEQKALYDSEFSGCAEQSPELDRPNYGGYFVQRVEVDPANPTTPDWSKAKFIDARFTMADLQAKWGTTFPELVDDEFVLPNVLTFALPPVVDLTWGAEIAHMPEIPLSKNKLAAMAQAQVAPGANMLPIGPPQGRIRGPRGGGRVGEGVAPGGMGGMPGPAPATPRGGRMTPPSRPLGQEGTAEVAQADEPNYLLLRFFDFEVDPGKTYRYRVFLMLFNPNRGIDAKNLSQPTFKSLDYIGQIPEKQKLDEQNYVAWAEPDTKYADWSSPTPIVTVGGDNELLAGKVEIQRGNPEPKGELTVARWIMKTGEKLHTAVSALRGKFIDLPPDRHNPDIDFSTKDTVVDLNGGEQLSRTDKDLTVPGEVLVMTPAGNLVICSELKDEEEVEKLTKPAKQPRDDLHRLHGGGGQLPSPRPKVGASNEGDDLHHGR
jgi:hypothetical protein